MPQRIFSLGEKSPPHQKSQKKKSIPKRGFGDIDGSEGGERSGVAISDEAEGGMAMSGGDVQKGKKIVPFRLSIVHLCMSVQGLSHSKT